MERSDARKMERELKIKFDWREADKNLEKEERNKPLDLSALSTAATSDLLSLETRSWKSGDAAAQPHGQPRSAGSSPYHDSGSRGRSGGFGGGRGGYGRGNSVGRSGTSRAGSSHAGPARRGQ
jgi:ATP-dependent RNA helicase RhlE